MNSQDSHESAFFIWNQDLFRRVGRKLSLILSAEAIISFHPRNKYNAYNRYRVTYIRTYI